MSEIIIHIINDGILPTKKLKIKTTDNITYRQLKEYIINIGAANFSGYDIYVDFIFLSFYDGINVNDKLNNSQLNDKTLKQLNINSNTQYYVSRQTIQQTINPILKNTI